MIVADSNTIAYLYLPTKYTKNIEKLLQLDSEWVAPALWRSELRNILALYMRQKIVDFETACKIQAEAESLLGPNEYNVDSLSVLTLTQHSGCSAYDCEFVALAKALNIKLVTEDKKVRRSFPEIAMTAKKYIDSLP